MRMPKWEAPPNRGATSPRISPAPSRIPNEINESRRKAPSRQPSAGKLLDELLPADPREVRDGWTESQVSSADSFDVPDGEGKCHWNGTLVELAHLLVEADSVEQIAAAVRRITLNLFEWDAFLFSERIAGTDQFLRVLAADTMDGVLADVDQAADPPKPYRTSDLLHRGELLYIANPAASEVDLNRFGDSTRASECILYAPIMFHGTLHGIISVQSYTRDKFNESDLKLLGAVTNLTAPALRRAQAERHLQQNLEELRVGEERHRAVIRAAGAIPYERDFASRRWVHLGDAIESLTGYTDEQFTPELFSRITKHVIFHGELEGLAHEEALKRALTGEVKAWRATHCITTRSGEERWISDSAVIRFEGDGRPCGSIGMLHDVSDTMRMTQISGELSALGCGLSAARTAKEVAQIVSKTADHLIGWDAFFIHIYTNEDDKVVSVLNIDTIEGTRRECPSIYEEAGKGTRLNPEAAKRRFAPTELLRSILDHGARMILRDAEGEDVGTILIPYGDATRPSMSLLYAPIMKNGRTPVGVISLQSYQKNAYATRDLEVLKTLADHCSGALGRAFAEQKLDRMEERTRVFSDLAHRLSFSTTPKEAGRIISRAAGELIGWDASFLDLYDSETDTIVEMLDVDTIGSERIEVPLDVRPKAPTPSERRVLQEGAFLIEQDTGDKLTDGFVRFGDTSRTSATLMFVPARTGNEVVAFLSIQSYTPHAYTHEQLNLFQALADHCAGALERIRAEDARRVSEERYALAASAANDGLWDWDLVADRIHYSSRWKATLGYGENEVRDQPAEWFDRVHPDDLEALKACIQRHLDGSADHVEHEYRMLRKDGSFGWCLCRGVAVRDGGGVPIRMVGSLTDITQRREADEQLLRSAFYDPLTGLANRALFVDRLEQCLNRQRRNQDCFFAVMFLDLDRFKLVNDTMGHPVGDELLREIAKRLTRRFRASDTVARIGGDEFTVILNDLHSVKDAVRIAQRLLGDLATPFLIHGHEIFTSVSIGITTSEVVYHDVDEIVRDADIALYRAKDSGKGRYEIFDQEMRDRVVTVLDTEKYLRSALKRNELVLHYQPIFSLRTGEVTGFEALLRWNHPERGLLRPGSFMEVAEDSGLIVPIGEWVIGEACRQIADWRRRFAKAANRFITVNISAKQLASPDISDLVRRHLLHHQLDGNAIQMEITETAILQDPDKIRTVLESWKKLGVKILLDDFGTGYSSLSHLKRYPVDCLKIDRAFVSGLTSNADSQLMVRAVLGLASILRMSVIAEGAETEEQVGLLKTLHCEYVQGYFLSRPLTASDAEKYLRDE